MEIIYCSCYNKALDKVLKNIKSRLEFHNSLNKNASNYAEVKELEQLENDVAITKLKQGVKRQWRLKQLK